MPREHTDWDNHKRVATPKPRIGDRAFAVDWCASIPLDENGDGDLDRADDRCEIFATKDAAMRRAAAVLPIDAFGVVQITPVVFAPYDEADARRFPHVGFWAVCGETVAQERE